MAHEEVRQAYQLLGNEATLYDGMITCATFLGKAICKLVWDMNKTEADRYQQLALSGIPEDFSGRLLEVPVGTGVLTMPVYRKLKSADATCLDYSAEMMSTAQKRAERFGLQNVRFLQGDVGALPFEGGSFDIVLSLNGFHAFPDKDAAYRETFRVLKSGGVFCGCFYIQGKTRRTDWFIRHFYEPKGFFTPPFETAESLKKQLNTLYESVTLNTVKSIVCFCCRKGE
ncbi:Methyltransferase domain-containing protein [Sporobacter termitidis DSM 10068]|uniref:Methyltransferase domain-containing protein n=1 Tax=Sporobacter termitidis DSM 10068 TaxID=1123282 RepID=A0A1M5W5G5_9FIRM|nr:class I SAM-dependent methyltransferase [Sporobacter termitidis]SHH82715.1 Methyltransferase domain-containing protein [Sporobacter termitidis DSM 10068]